MSSDACKVISDTSKKFKLFMGHVLRKRSQSQQIREKDKYIEEICRQTKGKVVKAVVIMDFKMKFEAKSARESSVENFGK